MLRWGVHEPIWSAITKKKRYPSLQGEIFCDVVIVGGGITGVLTAFHLLKKGLKVVLVEASKIASGATGHSTGHLTEVLDQSYKDLVSKFGRDTVRSVVISCRNAISEIAEISKSHGIDCGFESVSGFKIAAREDDKKELQEDLNLAQEWGLEASMKDSATLEFKNQALFNPTAFTEGVCEQIIKLGGQIFEDSHVSEVNDEEKKVVTCGGTVHASHMVLATHTPVGSYVSLHTRIAPYFSYVMAARLKNTPPPGLYWDTADPYNYYRPLSTRENIWIIGGQDHKTGQVPSTLEHYILLENHIHKNFDVEEILYYWGDEVYESVDGLPYIGKIPFTDSIYTAAGFSGTGLTWGTVAASLLSDQITETENIFSSLYSPSRVKPAASATNFIKENINVAKWMVGEFFDHHQIAELKFVAPGEGKVVDTDQGKLAVYREKNGELKALSSICPHMGGTVHWNTAEKTWDCPCHGGRFCPTGEVFSGPPLTGLENVPLHAQKTEGVEKFQPLPSEYSELPENLGLT